MTSSFQSRVARLLRGSLVSAALTVMVLAAGCASSQTSATAAYTPAASTEILWDSYGVPHIYAADRLSLAYAFGWAQMRNHSDLMLRLFLQGRGRAAEFLGESYLSEDRWVWTTGIPAMAARDYALQTPETRAHTDAFAAGINAFAKAHPTMVGDSLRSVLPVTGADIVANAQRLTFARFITSSGRVNAQTRTWAERGSNAWAIAPSRSASGKSLLLANPHLPWSDVMTWMEAQYTMPGADVYGAALVGSPVLQIAFNDNLGWTHTANTQDGEDLYELTLTGAGYMLDGQPRPFDESAHVIRVRGASGVMRDDTVRVRRSVHGPVVAAKSGKAIALRAVGMGGPPRPHAFQQWWEMGRAKNLAEFERAIGPNQISGQNITYADRDGHIMVFYGGNTPVRAEGDRAFWTGIVPGEKSSMLWTKLHGFADMPRTLDPATGWVQNANDPPWWSTFPVSVRAQDYPSYFGPRQMSLRSQRSVRLLQADSSITFNEFVTYKHSTRMELADRVLDDLLPAARASGSAAAKRAVGVLEKWDRSADADSRGAVLFSRWWGEYGRRMAGRSAWAIQWNEQRPLDTPDGISDGLVALAALDSAASEVLRLYGSLDVPWGDVYRLRRDNVDLPSNGAPDNLGVFRVTGHEPASGNRRVAVSGDSYVAAIEFASPIRAMSIVAYGNASRSGSPHRTDQLQLFSRKELKPVWRTRAEVEAHLETRERF